MALIALQVPIVDDAGNSRLADIQVESCFNEEELTLLRRYVRYVSRLRTCTLLARGMSGFKGLSYDSSGVQIRAGECTDPELHELLHVLRPMTLEEEPASYSRIASLVGRRIDDATLRASLKLSRRIFKDGEMSLFFQVHVGGQPLFAESLLRTWLNGTQYHTDDEKEQAWSKLEQALGEPNARAVVVSQLHGRVTTILTLDYIAQRVLAAHEDAA